MLLGCFQSNQGLRQLDFGDFVQQAAALGYTAIDMPLGVPDAAARCRDLGLVIHSAGPLFLPDLSGDAARQQEIVQRLTDAIAQAAAAQAPTITALIGRAMDRSGDDNIAIFRDLFSAPADQAADLGITLCFENWPRNGTMLATTPEMWDAMFNAVPSAGLGLCYDPSHFYWQGIDYIQPMWDFRDRIKHAHAKDTEILLDARDRYGIYGRQLSATPQPTWWRYRLPGFGGVDWPRYIDTLYQIGYDAVLSVEHEDPVWSATPDLALRGLTLAHRFLTPLLV